MARCIASYWISRYWRCIALYSYRHVSLSNSNKSIFHTTLTCIIGNHPVLKCCRRSSTAFECHQRTSTAFECIRMRQWDWYINLWLLTIGLLVYTLKYCGAIQEYCIVLYRDRLCSIVYCIVYLMAILCHHYAIHNNSSSRLVISHWYTRNC